VPIDRTELAGRVYVALNRRDLAAFLAPLDPAVEFDSLVAEAEGRTFRGHDGVREWWEEVVTSLGGIHFEPVEIRELSEDAVLVKVRAGGEASGVRVEQTMWQVSLLSGDTVVWWHVSRTEQEALNALALKRAR
jgi:hypothetical protein